MGVFRPSALSNPADPVSAIAAAVGAGFQLTSTIVGAAQAGKQRKHEAALTAKQTKAQKLAAKEATKTAKWQAEQAKIEAAAQREMMKWGAGALVLSVLLASMAFSARRA